MQTRSQRTFATVLAVIALTGASWMIARKTAAVVLPQAPAYRQKGPTDAKVVIWEYSDFQCPACRAGVAPLKQIEKMFAGKIRVIFKHYPLRMHVWARGAAAAAECAGQQGKFWDFHDLLFAEQPIWSQHDYKEVEKVKSKFKEYGKTVGLDVTALDACMNDAATAQTVTAEILDAQNAWINSTPTFFINGRRFVGAGQLRTLGLNHIENELAK
jgi:protein-disulfide isomerase